MSNFEAIVVFKTYDPKGVEYSTNQMYQDGPAWEYKDILFNLSDEEDGNYTWSVCRYKGDFPSEEEFRKKVKEEIDIYKNLEKASDAETKIIESSFDIKIINS